jgi:hypothetical protein
MVSRPHSDACRNARKLNPNSDPCSSRRIVPISLQRQHNSKEKICFKDEGALVAASLCELGQLPLGILLRSSQGSYTAGMVGRSPSKSKKVERSVGWMPSTLKAHRGEPLRSGCGPYTVTPSTERSCVKTPTQSLTLLFSTCPCISLGRLTMVFSLSDVGHSQPYLLAGGLQRLHSSSSSSSSSRLTLSCKYPPKLRS